MSLFELEMRLQDEVDSLPPEPQVPESIPVLFKELIGMSVNEYTDRSGYDVMTSWQWFLVKEKYNQACKEHALWKEHKARVDALRSEVEMAKSRHSEYIMMTPPRQYDVPRPLLVRLREEREFQARFARRLDFSDSPARRNVVVDESECPDNGGSEQCFLCMERDARVVADQCGHTISCGKCFNKMERDECPLCRSQIASVTII